MALPSSGALSMSAINAEFGRGNNLGSYRGTQWYTAAGGSGTFPSGAISFNNFYGTQLAAPTYSIAALIVAGGGGGGGYGGGGGGGGYRTTAAFTVSVGTGYSIVVGGGGASGGAAGANAAGGGPGAAGA